MTKLTANEIELYAIEDLKKFGHTYIHGNEISKPL